MSVAPRRDAAVLLFFLCVFALFSSGRLASSDALEQLRVSMLLASSGSTGLDSRAARIGWGAAPNGRLYEPHDIGNAILMLPAAWVGLRFSSTSDPVADPPSISRVAASLTCACLAALACAWMFRLAALFTAARTALLIAVAFPATTIFFAYARAAWDVLGACACICGVLYYSALLLRGTASSSATVWLAATLACACSFRYSLTPFFVPAAAWIVWAAPHRMRVRDALIATAVFTVLMVPTFAYNVVRTGSPLRPGNATTVYLAGASALTGNMAHGVYGLLFSPNRGLFVYAPLLLVSFGLPLVWRRLRPEQRRLMAAYGLASAAYVLLISRLTTWGAFGWGARYLLPILPVIFIATVFAALHARGIARACVAALAIVSAVLTIPSAIVNWHLATTTWPEAVDPDARRPLQQMAAWRALGMGLRGESLPLPEDGGPRSGGGGQGPAEGGRAHPTTGTFPDLLVARVARQSTAWAGAALVFSMTMVGVAAASARRVMADG